MYCARLTEICHGTCILFSFDGLIASIILLICTSLWIKASAKCLNVNAKQNMNACSEYEGNALHVKPFLPHRKRLRYTNERFIQLVCSQWSGSYVFILNLDSSIKKFSQCFKARFWDILNMAY